MSKTYTHPVTGKTISRQRFDQIQNKENGMCMKHKNRKDKGGGMCAECRKISGTKRNRTEIAEDWSKVDWLDTDAQIAKSLKTSVPSIRSARCRLGVNQRKYMNRLRTIRDMALKSKSPFAREVLRVIQG